MLTDIPSCVQRKPQRYQESKCHTLEVDFALIYQSREMCFDVNSLHGSCNFTFCSNTSSGSIDRWEQAPLHISTIPGQSNIETNGNLIVPIDETHEDGSIKHSSEIRSDFIR